MIDDIIRLIIVIILIWVFAVPILVVVGGLCLLLLGPFIGWLAVLIGLGLSIYILWKIIDKFT